MAYSEAQKEATARYNKKEQLQTHTQACGESLNGYQPGPYPKRDNAAPGPAEGLTDAEGGDA